MARTIGGIEVFEVGYQQLKDMIATGNVYQPVYNSVHWFAPDTYVIVICDVTFAHEHSYSRPTVWCGYVETEVEDALPSQFVDMSEYGMDYRYCRELEVWHVVDDGDLWQDWERLVDESKYRGDYHVMEWYHGYDSCIADVSQADLQGCYPIKYLYRVWEWDGTSTTRLLREGVRDTMGGATMVDYLRQSGYKVHTSYVSEFAENNDIWVVDDEGAMLLRPPLRVCDVLMVATS